MRKKAGVTAALAVLASTTVIVGSVATNKTHHGSRSAVEPAAQVAYDPRPINWSACTDELLVSAHAECGYLEVPLDYGRPDGAKIELAVSRVDHQSEEPDYQGVVLINPGAAGGPGLPLSTLGRQVAPEVGRTYDWIGFDARGVGASRPALTCDDSYRQPDRADYTPDAHEKEDVWLARAEHYAGVCAASSGDLVKHVRTTDSASDMDALRKALGREQINFVGMGYGTYLGQVYSAMYPDRMRRMVLDGVGDPTVGLYELNIHRRSGLDRSLHQFFAWVARHDSVYRLGRTSGAVEELYHDQLQALDKKPAGGRIGSAEWTDIFQSAAQSVNAWIEVAAAFAGWIHDEDWQILEERYDAALVPGSLRADSLAVLTATTCTDTQWPKDWAQWVKDSAAAHARAPYTAWSIAWHNAPCLYWPAEPGAAMKVDSARTPTALFVHETYDGVFPYAGALEARARFPRAALIEGVGGTSHGVALHGNVCIDDAVSAYLRDGTLPRRVSGRTSDFTCAPTPEPELFPRFQIPD